MENHEDTVICEHCYASVEVTFYPSEDGESDIESSVCCPPEQAYHDPTHCTECNNELLIETNADLMENDAEELAAEMQADLMRENEEG